jgi:hypothetical protein
MVVYFGLPPQQVVGGNANSHWKMSLDKTFCK